MVTDFSSEGNHRFAIFSPRVKEETHHQIPGVMGERIEQQSVSEGGIP